MLFGKRPIDKESEERLVKAIAEAERNTSGEIRLHIDSKPSQNPVERAKELFAKLNMHQTALRNGILFYVNFTHHEFAIWGDEGINNKVPDYFWDNIKETAIAHFKKNEGVSGLEKCILQCGEQLKAYFPLLPNDKNELSNDISFG